MSRTAGVGRARRPERQIGSVSAEAAVALPALVVVLAAGLWGVGVASLQAQCVSAARSAALAGARGEPAASIDQRIRTALGPDSTVALARSGNAVTATVSARHAGLGLLPSWPVTARATAELEPGPGTG